MNNFARRQARRDGVKIFDKISMNGYRVSEGYDGWDVELMWFDEIDMHWEQYDCDFNYPTATAARDSARSQLTRTAMPA